MAEILLQLKQTIVQLKEKNAEHEKTIAKMKDEQAAANNRIKELEGLREKLAKKNQEAAEELAATKTALTSAKGDAYKTEMEQAKQLVEKKNVQIMEQEKQIETMRTELGTLQKKEQEAVQLTQKIPTLQGEVEQLTKDKQTLEAKVKSLETKIIEIGGEKGFKAQELLDLNSALLASNKELADLKQQQAKEDQAHQNVVARVAAQDKELAALKAELYLTQQKGSETLSQLDRETERAKKVDILLADAKNEIAVLKTEMAAKSPELSEMVTVKTKLQATQDELRRLKDAHEACAQELERTKAELQEKTKKVEQLYAIHSTEKQSDEMMVMLRNELEHTKQRLDDTEKRRHVLEIINTRVSGELEAANKALETEKNKPTGVAEKDNLIAHQSIRIKSLEEQLKASEESNSVLNAGLRQADKSELIEKLQHSNLVLNDKIRGLPKLEEDLASTQQQLVIARSNVEEAQHNIHLKTKEIDECKSTIRALEQKIAEQNALFADLSKLTSS